MSDGMRKMVSMLVNKEGLTTFPAFESAPMSPYEIDERIDKILNRPAGEPCTVWPDDVVSRMITRLRIAEGSVREAVRAADAMEREAPKPAAGGFIAEAFREALGKGARAALASVEKS